MCVFVFRMCIDVLQCAWVCAFGLAWHVYETRLVVSDVWHVHKNHALLVGYSCFRIAEDFG